MAIGFWDRLHLAAHMSFAERGGVWRWVCRFLAARGATTVAEMACLR